MNLERSISCFDVKTERLSKEIVLTQFPIESVRLLWETNEDREMLCEYAIDRTRFLNLQRLIPELQKMTWEDEKYSYFLSCSTRNQNRSEPVGSGNDASRRT